MERRKRRTGGRSGRKEEDTRDGRSENIRMKDEIRREAEEREKKREGDKD